MGYIVIRPENHEQWLEERMKGIGSSDAGTIMGASPFSSPLRLWRQRMGLEPPTQENRAMRFGHAFEPAVAEFFAMETGATIDYSSAGDWIAVDEERPYLRVSPDRLFWPSGVEQVSDNWWILEVKTTRKAVDKNNPPLYWYCQVQYQMGVMGIKHAVIVYLTSSPSLDVDWIEVDFNPAFFATLVSMIEAFWNINILQKVEPEASDAEDVTIKYPAHEDGKSVTADEQTLRACMDVVRLKKEKKDIEEAIANAENMIKLCIKDAEQILFPDPATGEAITAASYKSVTENSLDEDRLRKELPEVYEEYCQQVFDRKRFTEEKGKELQGFYSKRKGSRRLTVKPITEKIEEFLNETAAANAA